MQINDLHPAGVPRRLRLDSLLLQEGGGDVIDRLPDQLRDKAKHLDDLADIWAKGRRQDSRVHLTWHYRRTARRLRDTAAAIEREHAAGPWADLDQPLVHLSEARPASKVEA